jgi:pyruvate kinase
MRRHARIEAVLPKHRASALNLAQYVGLRRNDLRALQLDLAGIALSSLGRSEGHVADTLERIAHWLGAPEAAAVTADWVEAVLTAGADVLRINAAHESPAEWEAAIALIRRCAAALRREIRIFIDLPGPKLRAEIRRTEPGVLHLPRAKDRLGRTTAQTSIALEPRYVGGAQLPVPPRWLRRMRAGDVLSLSDAAGRARELVVRECTGDRARAECDRTLYLTGGLALAWKRGRRVLGRGRVGTYPRQPAIVQLSPGDEFVVGGNGRVRAGRLPALYCPAAEVLGCVRPGERVLLDDGRIAAIV